MNLHPDWNSCLIACQAAEEASYTCSEKFLNDSPNPMTSFLIKLFKGCAWQRKLMMGLITQQSKHMRQAAEYCAIVCGECLAACEQHSSPAIQGCTGMFESALMECRILAASYSFKY